MLSVLNTDLFCLRGCRHGFECHCLTMIVKLPLYRPQACSTWPTWWGSGPRQLIPILAWPHWLFLVLLSFSQSFPFVHSPVLAAFQCISQVSQLCLTNISLITMFFLCFSKLLNWTLCLLSADSCPFPHSTVVLGCIPVAIFSRVSSKHRFTQSLLFLEERGAALGMPLFCLTGLKWLTWQ